MIANSYAWATECERTLSQILTFASKRGQHKACMPLGPFFLRVIAHSQLLAGSSDPAIPYTIIAANTSIVPAALQPAANQQSSPLERLMQKLFNKVVEKPFFGQPNDIAVTVKSINSVCQERSPQPQIQEVGCDHLVYFSHPAGLAALSTAVIQAQGQAYRPVMFMASVLLAISH